MKILIAIGVMCIIFSPIIGMITFAWLLENKRLFKIMKYLEKKIY